MITDPDLFLNSRFFSKKKMMFLFAFLFSLPLSLGYAESVSLLKPAGKIENAKLFAPGIDSALSEGDVNAPVTIVEYASLTCGHCQKFFLDVYPKLQEKYIKTGKIRYIFREFAFDPRATAGFMIARCLPKDQYNPMIITLYKKVDEWAFVDDALSALRKIAQDKGMSDQNFFTCLKNPNILNQVNASYKKGLELGIQAIPTFFINGDKYEGGMSFKEIEQLIAHYTQISDKNSKKKL